MKVIYILFQTYNGYDEKFMGAYADVPDKTEIENQCFCLLTDGEYRQLYNGTVIDKHDSIVELRQYTLK